MAPRAGDLSAAPAAGAPVWTDVDLEQPVAARFERQAARTPGRLALRSRTRTLTYGELGRWVNRIANCAVAVRGDQVEPMALLLSDGIASIAGILSAYAAGKIRLHLDASLPPERLRFLLKDSGAGLLASGGTDLPRARSLAAETGIPLLDLDADEVESAPETSPGLRVSPDTPAHLIYTSGSTGRPNGVASSHRNVLWGAARTPGGTG